MSNRVPTPRLIRALLWLFPERFRAEHGGGFASLLEDMREEWKKERGGTNARFWAALAWDVVSGAVGEWSMAFRKGIESMVVKSPGEHMSALMGDVRFALRQLNRHPLHGITIVILMTVGVAGNAGMFRIFNGLFLRPLPFEEPGQLVDLDETAPEWQREYTSVAYPDFVAWREHNRTFQSMAAYRTRGMSMTSGGGARRIECLRATHDIDDVLRLDPELGRFFTEAEDVPGAGLVGLLSVGFWEQEFARDPGVLGQVVILDDQPVEVIGVLPEEARLLSNGEIWLPLQLPPDDRYGWSYSAIGRMKPGVSVEQAREDLLAVHKGIVEARPVNEITHPTVDSLRDRYLGEFRLGSGLLLAAVGIILLIACANIAGLMLARGVTREGEISVRLALGAPRMRIVRQLLTESAILAVFGGVTGTALGTWISFLLIRPMAIRFPTWVTFDLDWRFVTFTLALSGAAVLLFGLVPALRASASGGSALRRTTLCAQRRRGMNVLVAAEVALAMMLLVVGGLSSLDIWRLRQTDPGFDSERVMTYQLKLPSSRYPDSESRLAFMEGYAARLNSLPGVESATLASSLPLRGNWGWLFEAEGVVPAPGEESPMVLHRVVYPGYFETMGVTILEGRSLNQDDGRDEGSQAVVVNESFVRSHLEGTDDPIGRRVRPPGGGDAWMTVVGVAQDVRHYGVDEETRPGIYQPLRQLPLDEMQAALRTTGDPMEIMAQARAVTAEMDPELPIFRVETMATGMEESLWDRRATSWIIATFSGIALLLAVAGLYGVISYSVAHRRKEISIRMALGARGKQVRWQVLKQGVGIVMVGVAIGLAGALAGARVVSGILVGVSARNPVVYLGVTLLLLLVALAANYFPARRAASLEPGGVLREE